MSDIQEKIDELMTPVELANELEMNAFFTRGQAEAIAAEVYQPLLEIIKMLADGGQADKLSLEITGESTCLNDTNIRELIAGNEALKAEIEGLKVENINLGDRKANIKDAYDGLCEENSRMYGKNERLDMLIDELKAEIEKLKRMEQKGFWWSAEFTETMHNNNIRSAWNDWCGNGRKMVQ